MVASQMEASTPKLGAMRKKRPSCIIIGTGFSGIAMGIKLKEKGINDFIILEKASEVGGTWRENTYPGAECDIPSALYSYSFEPYPYWEYKWSLQPQILDYIKYVVNKYELYPHIRFDKEMVRAHWQEQGYFWEIACKDGSLFTANALITAIGQLHHPSIPDFEGKDTFEGTSWHSAQWNHEVSLVGKTVGVIGNAASAVQFIPEIAKVAKKVKVFQRTANWMLPKQDRSYKEWEKKLVARLPILLKTYRQRIWLMGGALYFLMQDGNHLFRKLYQWLCIRYIKKYIKDPEMVKKLTPNYPLGAKRVLFSDTYYEALARDNVALFSGGVQRINRGGVVTGEQQEEAVDVLIYSTGFKTNPFLLGLDIRGKGGLSIQEAWKDAPKSYLGMSTAGFPNLFTMYGPNTNLGHNSIILMSEAQANYIAQCINHLEQATVNAMAVKAAVMEAYHEGIQTRLKKMIWARISNSWYQAADGSIPNNYPGRTMEYIRKTKKVQLGDFEIN